LRRSSYFFSRENHWKNLERRNTLKTVVHSGVSKEEKKSFRKSNVQLLAVFEAKKQTLPEQEGAQKL